MATAAAIMVESEDRLAAAGDGQAQAEADHRVDPTWVATRPSRTMISRSA